MSCHEWEEGTIKIPTKEWAKFRTAVIKTHNAHQLALLEKAKTLHAKAKDSLKGKRGKNRQKALGDFELLHHKDFEALSFVFSFKEDPKTKRLERVLGPVPKKKDLKILPTSKDAKLELDEATIVLINKTRTVTWIVPENNHAREHARKHPVARKLFQLLNRMTWTPGSGGQLVGNDEYNQEASHAGGGANYVTATYSQKAQKLQRYAVAPFEIW